ncbi:MAG TPA: FAD-binding oxidoreductase [Candidatus Limnocylindrales bacterium]|nr:FAD-binding oxidoreductase [Candidatus Limnocylindrales bacterium]
MTTSTTRATTVPIEQLRSAVRGRIVVPGEPDFDALASVMYGGLGSSQPAAIVRVLDAADVAATIRIARTTATELAVRSGGHSAAGHSTNDGGIVIDVRELTGLDIDVAGRTAWAGSGLTAGAYTLAAAEHGLATGFGDTGSVGIGGITLGGGVGYLGRKHGLTIDNLLAAEIVTADGEAHLIDAAHEPDLFWAIRGGGGNFGVATRFRYRLHDVRSFVGGMLVLPATADTTAGFIAEAHAAPDELSTIANVMNCPPLPFVAEEHHGAIVILAMMAYAGDVATGQSVLASFRSLATPLADLTAPMAYPGMYPPDDPDYHPTAVSRNMFIDHVDRPVAETIVRFLDASDASIRVAQLRVLGGAIARVPPDETAYAHRASPIMVNVAAFYDGESDKPQREAWVAEFAAALHQGDTGAYVNFVGDEGEARVRAAYPGATWDRLARVKAAYDPDNVFHHNQNVPPAAAAD